MGDGNFKSQLAVKGQNMFNAIYDNSIYSVLSTAGQHISNASAKTYFYEFEIVNQLTDKTFVAGEYASTASAMYQSMALTKVLPAARKFNITIPIESEQMSFETGMGKATAKLAQYGNEFEYELEQKYFSDEVMFGISTFEGTTTAGDGLPYIPAKGTGADQLPAGSAGTSNENDFGYIQLTYTSPTLETEQGQKVRNAIQAAVTALKTSINATTRKIPLNMIVGYTSTQGADALRAYLEDRAGSQTPEIFKNDWRFIGMVAGIPIIEAQELNGRGTDKEIVIMRTDAINTVLANKVSKVSTEEIDPILRGQAIVDAHQLLPWAIMGIQITDAVAESSTSKTK